MRCCVRCWERAALNGSAGGRHGRSPSCLLLITSSLAAALALMHALLPFTRWLPSSWPPCVSSPRWRAVAACRG